MEHESGPLLAQAKDLFERNHHMGKLGGVEYDYTCPSPFSYPHQWLWDSSFHAIVLSSFDPERAEREIVTLFAKQKTNGFVPAVNVWESIGSLDGFFYPPDITQPPVVPIAVETIYERSGDTSFVQSVYPNLEKSLSWLSQNRDKNGNGLIEIVFPWEDGDDRNPSFDKQLGVKKPRSSFLENYYYLYRLLGRYALVGWPDGKYDPKNFIAETSLFNSIYARSLLSLAALSKVSGQGVGTEILHEYEKVKRAMISFMWNEKDEIFYDLDFDGNQSGKKVISSLMPLILPDLPPEIYKPLIEKHLLNPKEFWTPFPIASVARSEPAFHPGKSSELWRGPVWINTNWFLSKALIHYGYTKEARRLINKTLELIKLSKFRECYNNFSGEGYGAKNFAWSTLALDMANLF